MVCIIRCKDSESIQVWNGEKIWFSPNLKVQRIWIEDERKLIIQVDSTFTDKRNEEKGIIAVVAYGEDPDQLQEPPELTDLLTRLTEKHKS